MIFKGIVGLVRTVVVSAALFLAGAMLPVAGGLVMLLAPAPILIYAVGRANPNLRALLSVAAAAGLVLLAAGLSGGVAYAATFGLASVLMVYMLERRYPFEAIVAATAAAVLTAATVCATLYAGSPEALLRGVESLLQAGITRAEHFYKLLGIQTAMPVEIRTSIVELTVGLSPALCAISAAVAALANLGLFWRLVGRERLSYVLFGDLAKWSTPEWLIWLFLATGFALFIPLRPMKVIALDAFVCVGAIYFCQGLAIMSFYFRMLAMPAIARVAVYLIAAVQPVLAALVCAAGIFDLWIDFRRLKPPGRAAGSFGDFL